jgi:phosphohistidine phosphatase SixA
MKYIRLFMLPFSLFVLAVAAARSETPLTDQALVEALRAGGYNIYFRHAATEWSQQDHINAAGDWTSCDPAKVRQLADSGRRTAAAVGDAIRALQIPVASVLASPYCRTVETARLLQLGEVETTTDIMNMRVAGYFGGTEAIAASARRRLSTPPPAGTNTILVAHGNVLVNATSVYPQEAEGVVFQPDGNGSYAVAARISPEQWARLADDYGNQR